MFYITLFQSYWPLEDFSSRLSGDLFCSSWETRHGAATALREIVSHHGHCAAKALNQTKEEVCIYLSI